jgi:Putative NADPH-quinone reductase (modulator of drug activity B)
MRALLISAAPSAQSLTDDLTRTASAALRGQGHAVDVLNLNDLQWDAVVRPTDYGIAEFDRPVGDHAVDARCEGTIDSLVGQHQRLVERADLIVLIFPLWWAGMPAVMKGWFDRVFTQGFAYGLHDAAGNSRKYGDGAFAGKRGLVITTTGDRESAFGERGLNGNIHDLLFPMTHGILWYTGIAPLESLAILGVDTPTWPGIEDARDQVRRRLASLDTEDPIPYRRMLEDYDSDRQLHEQHATGRTDLAIHLRPARAS